jgi:hypothetical protein
MGNIEIGSRSPEIFGAGKEDRVMEDDLDTGFLYSWFSFQSDGNASVYPSRIYKVTDHAPTGLLAVRFAILSAGFHEICRSYSLFGDGLYQGQRNGLPFIKQEPGKGVTVEDGYFMGPLELDPEELVYNGAHGSARPLQLPGYR